MKSFPVTKSLRVHVFFKNVCLSKSHLISHKTLISTTSFCTIASHISVSLPDLENTFTRYTWSATDLHWQIPRTSCSAKHSNNERGNFFFFFNLFWKSKVNEATGSHVFPTVVQQGNGGCSWHKWVVTGVGRWCLSQLAAECLKSIVSICFINETNSKTNTKKKRKVVIYCCLS